MSEPLDEQYFKWLCEQVFPTSLKNPARTYWNLCRKLYQKEFVWLVFNDENRLTDGLNLRVEFSHLSGIDTEDPWMSMGCSMLEMLIALSRRLAWIGEGEPADWFWHILDNVGLKRYDDKTYQRKHDNDIEEALDVIIWRRYSASGKGGLFPLRHPQVDQREAELWYQLNAYLMELL